MPATEENANFLHTLAHHQTHEVQLYKTVSGPFVCFLFVPMHYVVAIVT